MIALAVAVAAFNVNDADAAATAQLFAPRYVPDNRIDPAPIVSVPENWATTPPVATGQAEENGGGGVALPPVVGCEHTAICASVSVIALDVAVAAFNVNDAVDAATAQLFAPMY